MKKWDIFIGAEPFIGKVKNNSVFIDPDEKKLERLKENLSQGKNNVNCFLKNYTISADYKNVKWYLFSDNRFDGPLQLIDWNLNLPNLKEIESFELSGISLSDVLDECLGKSLDTNLVSITLALFINTLDKFNLVSEKLYDDAILQAKKADAKKPARGRKPKVKTQTNSEDVKSDDAYSGTTVKKRAKKSGRILIF